jgi:hypothetical protein
MIDTSIIRVHQQAACIARNRRQSMGRSRGGLTSKIHAVVITPRCNRNDPVCSARISTVLGNLVERFFNKIKRCRRVATRYDKLAANYLAFVQLASIRLWLRVNESTT